MFPQCMKSMTFTCYTVSASPCETQQAGEHGEQEKAQETGRRAGARVTHTVLGSRLPLSTHGQQEIPSFTPHMLEGFQTGELSWHNVISKQ